MPAGKTTGAAREYQKQCRDLLIREAGGPGLVPYQGDGIDVTIQLGFSSATFDVALRSPDGRLVVAECKRWRAAARVEQTNIKSFAYDVEQLRRVTGAEVAGFYFTSSDYQLGALKTAFDPGVRLVLLWADQEPPGLTFHYLRYDPQRDGRMKEAVAYAPPARIRIALAAPVVRVEPRPEAEPD